MATVQLLNNDSEAGGRVSKIYAAWFWQGQLFTPSQDAWPNSLFIYLKKLGSPDPLRVNIYAADVSHLPSGSPLMTLHLSATNVGTDFAWIDVPISNNLRLKSGTEYAITMELDTGDASNHYIGYETDAAGEYEGLVSSAEGTTDDWITTTYEKSIVLSGLDYVFDPPASSLGSSRKRLVAMAASALWYEDIG